MKTPVVSYDRSVQALYVRLSDKPYDHVCELSGDRYVNYAADGTPTGVEFLDLEDGVNLDDVPERDAIAKALESFDFRVHA